jgi:hypothetical protein
MEPLIISRSGSGLADAALYLTGGSPPTLLQNCVGLAALTMTMAAFSNLSNVVL